MNGHAVVNEPLDIDEPQDTVRRALTKEELQNLLFERIGLSKRECREMSMRSSRKCGRRWNKVKRQAGGVRPVSTKRPPEALGREI
jgi:hypothetical protein